MKEFIKKVEDLYNRSNNKNIVTCTSFLTPAEKQVVINEFNVNNLCFFGGAKDCERVRVFFLPDYMSEEDISNYIIAFKAEFSFRKLSHRDFLGALLGLGIERRCIGDIYVFENEAYFFVTSDIASFIKVNFNKVSNVGVKVFEINLKDVKILEPEFEEINFTVSSLRVDSLVAGAIFESREKVSSLIKAGNVLLNYLVCENCNEKIKEGDVFSVKGYGKFCLVEVGGISRRGRIFLRVKRYV